jgi:hypothetical protein
MNYYLPFSSLDFPCFHGSGMAIAAQVGGWFTLNNRVFVVDRVQAHLLPHPSYFSFPTSLATIPLNFPSSMSFSVVYMLVSTSHNPLHINTLTSLLNQIYFINPHQYPPPHPSTPHPASLSSTPPINRPIFTTNKEKPPFRVANSLFLVFLA